MKSFHSFIEKINGTACLLYTSENDYRAIARANGVGPKLAQKVVLELKDKVDKDALEQMSGQSIASREEPAYVEALQALTALGLSLIHI